MLIFLDLETTGLEVHDKICSIACLIEKENSAELLYDLVNEGKKIPPLASSINNITNEMLQGKPPLKDSLTYKQLQKYRLDATFIAHNVMFELDMLHRSGLEYPQNYVDTLRVTRHLIPDLESYSLNFLRYEMKLYKKEEDLIEKLFDDRVCIQPHNAQSDVIITKLLFDELLELASPQEMLELTNQPVLLQKFEFGKYAGRYIEEIVSIDRNYIEWMLRSIDDLSEDLRYTLEYYL